MKKTLLSLTLLLTSSIIAHAQWTTTGTTTSTTYSVGIRLLNGEYCFMFAAFSASAQGITHKVYDFGIRK